MLSNGHWLITWGARRSLPAADPSTTISVSEYDPATDTELFHMHMSREGSEVPTYRVYRVYREPEAAVSIPLNLP